VYESDNCLDLFCAGLSIPEAMAAGLFVSVTMLLLGLTGLMDMLNALVPTSVVRGIQLAVGLSLAQKVWSLCSTCWSVRQAYD